jgi:hypothetical protein
LADNITFSGENSTTIRSRGGDIERPGHQPTIHLPDGSTMTLVGITHIDSSFFH